ncbi:MAG TPA: hypothetical protein VH414_10330 [Lichenihabitans sp.]|nr:hypothetical protein [Lichenihabitans sp.]
MGHLDKRLDPDKDASTTRDGDVKGGVSGNVPDNAGYESNKHREERGKPAPDVVRKEADKTSRTPR